MAENVEQPVAETEAAEDVAVSTEQIKEEEKEFKNPQARARYLERENRVLEERLNLAMSAMAQITAAQRAGEEVEQPEGIEVDEDAWEANPLGVIRNELKSLKQKLEENEQRQTYVAASTDVNSAINTANRLLADKLSENREVFEGAYIHLFKVVEGEVADEMPGLTERERFNEVGNRLNLIKLAAIKAGRNPADDFIRKSKRFGWKEPVAGNEDGDAREQIKAERKKSEGSRTLSTMDGASPKARVDYTKMNKEEFNRAVDEGLKSGRFKREGNSYRTPPMRDLLPANKLIKQQ